MVVSAVKLTGVVTTWKVEQVSSSWQEIGHAFTSSREADNCVACHQLTTIVLPRLAKHNYDASICQCLAGISGTC